MTVQMGLFSRGHNPAADIGRSQIFPLHAPMLHDAKYREEREHQNKQTFRVELTGEVSLATPTPIP
jgi:hypothetical protein